MTPVHVFFDFDDTLCRGDSILLWMRFHFRRRPSRRVFQLCNWVALLLYGLRLIDSRMLKRVFLMPIAYEDPGELEELAAAFVREDLAPRFHAPVLERLWTHHLLGHSIHVISASATFYLRHLKAILPMADIQGTEMEWPARGWWRLPRYQGGNLKGANKIARLKALGLGEAGKAGFAYSDSHHDRPLLEFAEFPVCVRPGAKLAALARATGWTVMDWPRARPAWMEGLEKTRLLFLAAGGRESPRSPGNCDPAVVAARAGEYAPAHTEALHALVAAPGAAAAAGIFRIIFDRPPGGDPAPPGAG